MLRKILQFLIVGSFTTVIAACYGVIMDFQDRFFTRRIKTTDVDGNPIPELVVTLTDPVDDRSLVTDITDSSGNVELSFVYDETRSQNSLQLTIEDRDGPENGGAFSSFEGNLGDDDPLEITMDVEP